MAKYPFQLQLGKRVPVTQHLHGTYPGVDYGTWYGNKIFAPTHGHLRAYVDRNRTIYARFTQSKPMVLDVGDKTIVLPKGARWDFLHVKRVVGVSFPNWKTRLLRRTVKYVRQGNTIAIAGNSGNVKPLPTPEHPYAGTHTHTSIIVKGKFLKEVEQIINALPIKIK